MEPRTVPTIGGGELELSRGMQVDPVIYLDRRFEDAAWLPCCIGLEPGAAVVLRDALTEAIDELALMEPFLAEAS